MRAAVLEEVGSPLEVHELELAPPGPGEVKIRLRASGVCHSDLSVQNGTLQAACPVVLGHEGAGEVTEVGPGVDNVATGDHVILSWIGPCGSCAYCLGGQPNLCRVVRTAAAARSHLRLGDREVSTMLGTGTFAEEAVVMAQAAVPVPVDIPFDIAALVGCGVMTGVGAVINTARVRPGSSVVVLGCGGVGINIIQGARLAGARRILAVDPFESKREVATRFGATDFCVPDDLADAVGRLSGGEGFDYAFEAVGRSATIRSAWDATRRGGTTVVVGAGSIADAVSFTAGELFSSEKRLQGCVYGSADVRTDFARLLGLWQAGRLDLDALISRTISLEDVNDAFAAMERGEVVRSVIEL